MLVVPNEATLHVVQPLAPAIPGRVDAVNLPFAFRLATLNIQVEERRLFALHFCQKFYGSHHTVMPGHILAPTDGAMFPAALQALGRFALGAVV